MLGGLSASHIAAALDNILINHHDVGWNRTGSARTRQAVDPTQWLDCCQVLQDDYHGQVSYSGPVTGGQINVLPLRMVKTV